jgi:ABC-type Fe3+-hydroxamate transport system substrate-binding protein
VIIEWINPLFVAGHWTPDLVNRAGAVHQILQSPDPSREISPDELVEVAPEFLFVAPCGADLGFARSELRLVSETPWWQAIPAVASGNTFVLDGRHTFSRPSPALVDSYCLLVGILNDVPKLIPTTFQWCKLKNLEKCP